MIRVSERNCPAEVLGMQNPLAVDIQQLQVLGVPISLINMSMAVSTILGWIKSKTAKYVCIRDVHGVMRSQREPDLKPIHEHAGLVTPDGMPLVWLAKRKAGSGVGRVCGADLVDALCSVSAQHNVRHYFLWG